MTFEYNIEDRNNMFINADLYWEDIKNPSNIKYDDDVIDTLQFEDDMYRSWLDWCNETYADVDEDEIDEFFKFDEEAWFNDVKDSFNAEDYKR